MAHLADRTGGRQTLASRLEYLHSSGLLYIGDKQAFLNVFQFHYPMRPDLSVKTIHKYIPSQFHTGTDGLSGNDDSIAIGSFTVLNMNGMWPVSGQNVYLTTLPFFPSVSICWFHKVISRIYDCR
jgi:putative alpha-1,2-mannosidase